MDEPNDAVRDENIIEKSRKLLLIDLSERKESMKIYIDQEKWTYLFRVRQDSHYVQCSTCLHGYVFNKNLNLIKFTKKNNFKVRRRQKGTILPSQR